MLAGSASRWRGHPRALAVGAVLVAAVAITTVVVLATRGGSPGTGGAVEGGPTTPRSATGSAGGRSSALPTVRPSSVRPTQPTVAPTVLVLSPASIARRAGDAIAGNGSIYAVLFGPDGHHPVAVERLDPADGSVQARTPFHSAADPGNHYLALAGAQLWIATPGRGSVVLQDFGAGQLAAHGSITLAMPGARNVAGLVGSGGQLYLGAGRRVVVLDAATGRLVHRFALPDGVVTALAMAPGGRGLYVGLTPRAYFTDYGTDLGRVVELDPSTGAVLVSSRAEFGAILSLVASAGRVWIANQTGPHGEAVQSVARDLAGAARGLPGGSGGGGVTAAATVAGGAVWIGGGVGRLYCADPVSGRLRATVRLPNGTFVGQILSVRAVFVGHYASSGPGSSGLDRRRVPAACRS